MDLFVYGTLQSNTLMAAVAGPGGLHAIDAKIDNYRVSRNAGDCLPIITATPGGQAEGLIWQGLDADQIARLDAYEGAFGYRPEQVEVAVAGQTRLARCYLPPDDTPAGDCPWSLARWQADHLTPALLAAEELFALDPLPDQSALRRMWPMIEARAWSKYRATAGPATRRFLPAEADFDIARSQPPAGQFFRFETLGVRHRRFDGTQSAVLQREAFVGVDAAVLLPYDPLRDRVVLVEQARLGPRVRHDPNPWTLEPVAGIVDARETPRDAALREAREEAGIDITHLEEAGAFYVAPGASSDFFYTFVGLCDLPQSAPYRGGLPGEGEDLRLHPLHLDVAMALADSGEIQTGPGLYMLYWLRHHRDRLLALA